MNDRFGKFEDPLAEGSGLDMNGAPDYDLEEPVSMDDLAIEDLRALAEDYVDTATREELESILSFLREEDEFLR